MRTVYRCGKCGKPGHNRQTCRKQSLPHTTPSVAPVCDSDDSSIGDSPPGVETTFTAFQEMLDVVPETVEGTVGGSTVEGVMGDGVDLGVPAVETMTAEEIQMWWILSNGDKTGKRKTVTLNARGWKQVVEWENSDTEKLLNMLNIAIAQNTSPRALKKFLNFFGETAKRNLAKREDLPPQLFPVLAKDSSAGVKIELWQRHRNNFPDTIIQTLADDKNYDVRRLIAGWSKTPTSVLTKIFEEKDKKPVPKRKPWNSEGDLEDALVHNPNLHPTIHQIFLTSPQEITRANALKNPITSTEQLDQAWVELSKRDYYVRDTILGHENLSTATVDAFVEEMLAGADEPWPTINPLSSYSNCVSLAFAGRNRNVSPEILDKLYRFMEKANGIPYQTSTMDNVTENPSTSDRTLRYIARQKDSPFSRKAEELLRARKLRQM